MSIPEYDVALIGKGLVAPMLAMMVLDAIPSARLLLLSQDSDPGGSDLELVMPERLSGDSLAALGGAVVREWPGFTRIADDEITDHEEPVALIDPVQVWIDLIARTNPPRFIGDCHDVDQYGRFLMWSDGNAYASQVLRLDKRNQPSVGTLIAGSEIARHLDRPLIEENRDGGGSRVCRQSIPLGDERLLIRQWEWSAPDTPPEQSETSFPVASDPQFYTLLSSVASEFGISR